MTETNIFLHIFSCSFLNFKTFQSVQLLFSVNFFSLHPFFFIISIRICFLETAIKLNWLNWYPLKFNSTWINQDFSSGKSQLPYWGIIYWELFFKEFFVLKQLPSPLPKILKNNKHWRTQNWLKPSPSNYFTVAFSNAKGI